jgi:hypothetical protein
MKSEALPAQVPKSIKEKSTAFVKSSDTLYILFASKIVYRSIIIIVQYILILMDTIFWRFC